jgi:2-polyprenyl-3-methyl-5-hydroxy-6-metoxy-1,4-benzoquinol methylase
MSGRLNALCPQCHTKTNLSFRSKDYKYKITDNVFDHYSCPKCRLLFISPIPENLSDYYPKSYHVIPSCLSSLEAASKNELYKIEILRKHILSGRLLEIGPSYGSFTFLAKKYGFEVEAIEIDTSCCRFLNDVVGVKAFESNNPIEVLQNSKPYNVITLWHVIEHLPNPWATLEMIASKLEPNGVLLIATVNPHAMQFRIIGRRWLHLDAPRHISLIPSKLLEKKLRALNITLEEITMTDKGSIACSTGGWRYFFHRTCGIPYAEGILRTISDVVINVICRIISLVSIIANKPEWIGGAYTMVFRKNIETNETE